MSTYLTDLITMAEEFADMVGVDFVSTATWTNWANQGEEELFQTVSSQFKDTFYKTTDINIAANGAPNNVVTLPTDFRRLKGLDLDPTTPQRRAVHKYNFSDRNNFGRPSIGPVARDRGYRVVSRTTMVIEPPERCQGAYRLAYVNGPTRMALPLSVTVDVDPSDGSFESDGFLAFNVSGLAASGGFKPEYVGGTFTPAFGDPNTSFNKAYVIGPTPATANYVVTTTPWVSDVTRPNSGTVTLTWNAPNTTPTLMPELEPWAEYVAQVMARKALLKEESDISGVDERIAQIRQDIMAATETDEGEADSIVDVEDDYVLGLPCAR